MEELEKDPRIAQKIKRFRNKQAQMKHIFTEVKQYLLTNLTIAFLAVLVTGFTSLKVEVLCRSVAKCALICSKTSPDFSQRKQIIY